MTEDTQLTHTEQAMAYYGGDLSAEEKVAFEAHLAGCVECQALVAEARKYLPAAEAILAFQPQRTVEEQVRRFDVLVAAERRRVARYALALGAAVLMGLSAVALLRFGPRPSSKLTAPLPTTDSAHPSVP